MWKRFAVMIATLLVIGVNWLANSLPLNGRTAGEVSALVEIPFTPAGYVFSIWGLIYLGLLAYSLWQLRPASAGSRRLDAIVTPYLVSAAANMAWIFCWHWLRFGDALLVILVLLVSLVLIYRRLRREPPASPAERWIVDATFSLYCGWLCVATLANLGVWLESIDGWPFGLDATSWSVATLVFAASVFAIVGLRTRDVVYVAVLVWAAVGIALRDEQVQIVASIAWLVAAVALVVALIAVYRARLGAA